MRTVSPENTAISGQHEAGLAPRQRLEALGRLLGIVPVAHPDQRAAMHELAGLVRRRRRAVLAQHQDLGVRDRLADRVRPAIDFLRRQVRRAERLGEPVHEVRLGPGQQAAQCVQRLARHAAAGVREVAQVLADRRGPLQLRQLDVERRHRRQAGHALLRERVDHVLRQQVVEQDDARARVKRRGELAESGVERQRQRGEQRVVARGSRGRTRRSSRRRPCCDGTARRPWACPCCRTCTGSPPCRCR